MSRKPRSEKTLMNAQVPALPTAAKPPTLSDLGISTPLWRLLSSNVGAAAEIEEIASDPRLRSEALAVLPKLMARAAPSGDERVRNALQPLILVYGASEATRSPAFWQAYYRALAPLPVEALARGVEDYLAAPDSEFFPKPGPLRALCDKHAEPIFKAASRAKRALELPKYNRTPITPEERAKVLQMAREAGEKLSLTAASAFPKPPGGELPNTAGKPDEGGITPQMRALMARQQGLGG